MGKNSITVLRVIIAIALLGSLAVQVVIVPLLWIEYLLLRPVSRSLVLLAAMLNLVSLAVEAVSKVFMLLVLPVLLYQVRTFREENR